MGCDIHLHIELNVNGKWEHYGAPNVDRNYWLFALMANVRNYDNGVAPISNPKGLPDNISTITRLSRDLMGVGGHSDTWLSREEIELLGDTLHDQAKLEGKSVLDYDLEHKILRMYLFENSFAGDFPKHNTLHVEDVRFVFWFDS